MQNFPLEPWESDWELTLKTEALTVANTELFRKVIRPYSKALSPICGLDANAGLYFKSADNYYLGLSITNLLKTTFAKIVSEGDPQISTDRTLYLTGGYNFYLPNDQRFEIQPSFLIQSDLVSTQYNLTGIVNYNAKFWGGLNYRFGESVGVLVGMHFKDLGIGYSYDVNTMRLGVPGSHEISISYSFKIKGDKSRTSYKNTRYL